MSEPGPPLRAAPPPPPAPGSARYFALLYTSGAHRPALARLLALADELGTGVARGLDHEVAHARLQWWRHEAEQYALGRAQHPWLRAASDAPDGAPALDLRSLLAAAELDLAEGLQRGYAGERLRRALFVTAASLLGERALSIPQRDALADLGALSWQRERSAAHSTALPGVLARLGAAPQPALAPLLVWAALAAPITENTSLVRAFTDNIRAWRVARGAAAGTYQGS